MANGKVDLHQMRCFVCVAEELNFRRAAERLNMTQPPLSRQITLLEHAVGVQLLERNNHVVRLTAAGRNFFASVTDILERSEFAILSARQAERGEVGSIEMGFVPSAAFEFVPRIVAAIAEQLPGVSFSPIEMMSYEIVEALRAGRLDFGLTRSRGPAGPIQAMRVINEPFVLALPANGALAALAAPTLDDLDGADFIGYSSERGGYLRTLHEGLFATAGITPRVVLELSQTHAVLAMVDRGLGAALVPLSASMVHMANLTYRTIRIPTRFRSEIYLSSGARGAGVLHDRVRDIIRVALSDVEDAKRV